TRIADQRLDRPLPPERSRAAGFAGSHAAGPDHGRCLAAGGVEFPGPGRVRYRPGREQPPAVRGTAATFAGGYARPVVESATGAIGYRNSARVDGGRCDRRSGGTGCRPGGLRRCGARTARTHHGVPGAAGSAHRSRQTRRAIGEAAGGAHRNRGQRKGRCVMDRGAYRERIAEVMAGSHGAKVGYPIELRELEVLRTQQVGAGLLRVTFGGPELAGFHSYVPDEHVRVVFPDTDGTLRLPVKDGLSL